MKNSENTDDFVTNQEALIKSYFEKWINFSTKPIDRKKSKEAIKAAYRLISNLEPRILFFDSPLQMVKAIIAWTGKDTLYEIKKFIEHNYYEEIKNALLNSRDEMIAISNEMNSIENSKDDETKKSIDLDNIDISYFHDYIERQQFIKDEIDILIESSLGHKLADVYGSIRYKLDCDRIFYGIDTCFICDRPIKLVFTEDDLLYANDGAKVLEYADGFFAYSDYDNSDVMSEIKNSKYQKITKKQAAKIKDYFDKWNNIVLSKQLIDKTISIASIENIYSFLRLSKPEIIYFPNLLRAIKQIEAWKIEEIDFKPNSEIRQLLDCFTTEIESEVIERYGLDWYCEELEELWSNKYQYLLDKVHKNIDNQLPFSRWSDLETKYSLFTELEADRTITIDYAFSVLNIPGSERKEWQLYQDLVINCGWIIFGLDTVLLCNKFPLVYE